MGSLYSWPYSYHSVYNNTSFNIDTTVTHLIFTIPNSWCYDFIVSILQTRTLRQKEINVLVHYFNRLDGAHSC